MAHRSGPSVLKRQKEFARLQKQRDKAERRKAAREERRGAEGADNPGADRAQGAEDRDIAGIAPGPHPRQPGGA